MLLGALVILSAYSSKAGTGETLMGFAISGATTRDAGYSTYGVALMGNDVSRASAVSVVTGLNPGSNTFTAKYMTNGSGAAYFMNRDIIVIPLP